MSERDYVLGTHDAEVDRLGLQHRVWRPWALDGWRRAGFGEGQTLIDFGAGPGFASTDLAEIVGPAGRIVALERSSRFLGVLKDRADRLGLANIEAKELDLATDPVPALGADGAWARWIFAFLPQPEAAIARLAGALRPGARLVVHEYLDYATWRISPRSARFEGFVAAVMESWRATGGEPNVGFDMPRWLETAGFEIVALRPVVEMISPSDLMWRWPTSFIETNLQRLVELGRISAGDADALREELARLETAPGVRMATPVVLETIAQKRR